MALGDWRGSLAGRGPPDPPNSPRDYAAIVFFANSRFETGKRRLQFLSFADFAACAQSMMGHWSQGALGEPRDPRGTPEGPHSPPVTPPCPHQRLRRPSPTGTCPSPSCRT